MGYFPGKAQPSIASSTSISAGKANAGLIRKCRRQEKCECRRSGRVVAAGFGLEQQGCNLGRAEVASGCAPVGGRANAQAQQAGADRREHRDEAQGGLGIAGIANRELLPAVRERVDDFHLGIHGDDVRWNVPRGHQVGKLKTALQLGGQLATLQHQPGKIQLGERALTVHGCKHRTLQYLRPDPLKAGGHYRAGLEPGDKWIALKRKRKIAGLRNVQPAGAALPPPSLGAPVPLHRPQGAGQLPNGRK